VVPGSQASRGWAAVPWVLRIRPLWAYCGFLWASVSPAQGFRDSLPLNLFLDHAYTDTFALPDGPAVLTSSQRCVGLVFGPFLCMGNFPFGPSVPFSATPLRQPGPLQRKFNLSRSLPQPWTSIYCPILFLQDVLHASRRRHALGHDPQDPGTPVPVPARRTDFINRPCTPPSS